MSGSNLYTLLKPLTVLTTAYTGYMLSQKHVQQVESIEKPEVLPHVNLAILASTRASSSQATIDAIKNRELNASISCIISNDPIAFALQRASQNNIPAICVTDRHDDGKKKTRIEYHNQLSKILRDSGVDLILCIGYNKIIPDQFVEEWENRILNVHPSLLPAHKGLFDLDVHKAVLKAGDSKTGATIHYVTKEVDSGPIVVQMECDVLPGDTPETLKARVQALEGPGFVRAIEIFAANKLDLDHKQTQSSIKEAGLEFVMRQYCP